MKSKFIASIGTHYCIPPRFINDWTWSDVCKSVMTITLSYSCFVLMPVAVSCVAFRFRRDNGSTTAPCAEQILKVWKLNEVTFNIAKAWRSRWEKILGASTRNIPHSICSLLCRPCVGFDILLNLKVTKFLLLIFTDTYTRNAETIAEFVHIFVRFIHSFRLLSVSSHCAVGTQHHFTFEDAVQSAVRLGSDQIEGLHRYYTSHLYLYRL